MPYGIVIKTAANIIIGNADVMKNNVVANVMMLFSLVVLINATTV